jgi:hypothetical protein
MGRAMAAEQIEPAVRLGEWFIVGATVLGPVLAVQAQKWVERSQSKRAMKDGIFRTLMATRAARLAPEHVQALNMIDIAFYGRRVFGFRYQSKVEKTVSRAWRDYFDSLEIDNANYSEDQNSRLFDMRFDKFLVLLGTIAIAQNYDFDPVELRKKMYSPVLHGKVEDEQTAIRVGLAKILKGEASLPMTVTNLPNSGGG